MQLVLLSYRSEIEAVDMGEEDLSCCYTECAYIKCCENTTVNCSFHSFYSRIENTPSYFFIPMPCDVSQTYFT